MKKNITINLFGSLYAIDEDAYELLNQYQINMRRYFSNKEEGKEIAEDIEHRIAELFDELKISGIQAITIEHVQDIIKRIGNPEEIEDDSTETGATKEKLTSQTGKNDKKFFRNPEDKMLGGVISGIAAYVGFDVLPLRLAAVILAWFSFGIMVAIYLALWIFIPEAKLPEDRLRMQGRPVNMDTLRDEIVNGVHKTKEYASRPETQSKARGCLNGFLRAIIIIFKAILFIFIGGFVAITGLSLLTMLSLGVPLILTYFNMLPIDSYPIQIFQQTNADAKIMFITSSLIFLPLTLYIGIRFLRRLLGKGKPSGAWTVILLAIAWTLSLSFFITSTVKGYFTIDKISEEIRIQKRAEHTNTQHQDELDYLERNGWKVIKHSHQGTYVKQGEHHTGNRKLRYIDSWAPDGKMEYEVEKTEYVEPGTYRLEAVARTDGQGCFIYARSGYNTTSVVVPCYHNETGEIWQNAHAKSPKDKTPEDLQIEQANNGKGYGWSKVVINNIVTKDGVIHYGVTNTLNDYWTGTWFSATDFKLEKVTKSKISKNK